MVVVAVEEVEDDIFDEVFVELGEVDVEEVDEEEFVVDDLVVDEDVGLLVVDVALVTLLRAILLFEVVLAEWYVRTIGKSSTSSVFSLTSPTANKK